MRSRDTLSSVRESSFSRTRTPPSTAEYSSCTKAQLTIVDRWIRAKRRVSSRSSSCCLIDDVPASAGDCERELVLCDEMRDAGDVDERRAVADTRGDALTFPGGCQPRRQLPRQRSNVRARPFAGALDPIERAREPIHFDRLQEVVDGVGVERVERVRIVCRRENHERRPLQLLEQLESGQPRHLHVEEQHVDRARAQKRERLFRVHGAADDLDPARLVEQP